MTNTQILLFHRTMWILLFSSSLFKINHILRETTNSNLFHVTASNELIKLHMQTLIPFQHSIGISKQVLFQAQSRQGRELGAWKFDLVEDTLLNSPWSITKCYDLFSSSFLPQTCSYPLHWWCCATQKVFDRPNVLWWKGDIKLLKIHPLPSNVAHWAWWIT